ncbi:MAG TPA: enoyl-CoA hydratase/isomerase family protein [Thermoanaerobaculia bacterium]|nr:enoyl-CoA hydratase/isomerase family protein [Thermoanaerobaculia bacterium]
MIERSEADGIVTLRLDHGKTSALDIELVEALQRELTAAAGARAIVLTGTGSIFCAGVDLNRVVDGGPDYVKHFLPLLRDVLRQLFAMPMPVVAAANGNAIAGGALLVYASDLRLMSGGRIGSPELVLGVPFLTVALEILRFAVPRAQQFALTGRTVPPDEALAAGLIDEVVAHDALLARAQELASQLAAVPEPSFRLAKAQLRAPAMALISHNGRDAEALAAWSSPSMLEHIREYLAGDHDRTN